VVQVADVPVAAVLTAVARFQTRWVCSGKLPMLSQSCAWWAW
jgi:hypothetical protein